MLNSICDVQGINVGHAQNEQGATGCTVIIPDRPAVCGVSVAGGAPGTRETDCLKPVNLVQSVHGIYLGGGSAYGLAGADGLMRWCEENGRGIDTGAGIVPIVPGAVIFDLPVSSSTVRPDAQMGYEACLAASADEARCGNVGAGTGATVGKAFGVAGSMQGGLGTASIQVGDIVVGAIVAVNCFGDVINPQTGAILAGARPDETAPFAGPECYYRQLLEDVPPPIVSNTTIGAIATNARLTKSQATKIAMMTHDGYARAINPIHTMYDGDTIFTLSTGEKEADVTAVGTLAAQVMTQAILRGVQSARTAWGIPGLADSKETL